MISIEEALADDFTTIQGIAYKTWPVTYGKILTNPQLTYMLERFYSIDALNQNIGDGHCFLLAKENETVLGFASYVHNYPEKYVTKIPKIYVLPETQGKGIGKLLIEEIERQAQKNGSEKITLNVNRMNKAKSFYERLGFTIAAVEDVPIGDGYFQEDFVMEKPLP
jgi:ribosomal protein S18 acetylase RimI-like enzyme